MLWGSLIRPQKLSPHQPKKGHSPLLVAIHDAFRTSHFKEFLHSILPQSDETTQEGPLSYFIGPRKRAILDREEERPDFIDLLITRCEDIGMHEPTDRGVSRGRFTAVLPFPVDNTAEHRPIRS